MERYGLWQVIASGSIVRAYGKGNYVWIGSLRYARGAFKWLGSNNKERL